MPNERTKITHQYRFWVGITQHYACYL